MSKKSRRNSTLIASGLIATFVLSACAGNSAAPQANATKVDGGTIVYGHQQEPACVFGGWIEQAYLSSNVLDGLVSLDSDHKVVPWLADSWSVSSDQLTWTLGLKSGVKFTDGTPLTAGVVAYNFDYWVGGGNSTAKVWLDGYYKSATAIDDQTVQITLSQPYPRLIDNLTQGYFGIQSQHALETRTKEENCEAPIGSGAFVVKTWNRGTDIILDRNKDYTSPPANAKHTGPAYVDSIDWKFIADPTTRSASLTSGETNVIYDVPAIDWKKLGDAGFQLEKYVTPGRPQQLTFNTQQGPFVDEQVRQAFAYSLDRKTLVDTIGQGVIPFEGNGGVSKATPGYSQKAADTYTFDLDKANSLLDAAGWSAKNSDGYREKDGTVLEVVLPYGAGSIINADGASILQGVQEQAKSAGFKVKLIPVPQSELFSGAYSAPDQKDISVGYWTAVTSGILWINYRPSTADNPNYSNDAFVSDQTLADLITKANGISDVDAQNAVYEQAQEYIADHALSIGLYDRLSSLAVSPSLKDVWQENAQGGPIFYDAYFVK
ncbi:ABC transporter substrate-binding protein [Subtercola frigoramans]|uniref:Peptide/nickel transport system substrate-binding protein n=1 Tax=Subtercola frigoramans TaxID=120298 RepID=A0ABS2L8V9_9MICO|nr:ABC transporter substrate-binding protein [Subtercola frigoramans]MBM7473165.1 peptide/nickel transport system substrate-binding protein [Subtercola frigoramans]